MRVGRKRTKLVLLVWFGLVCLLGFVLTCEELYIESPAIGCFVVGNRGLLDRSLGLKRRRRERRRRRRRNMEISKSVAMDI